MASPANGSFTPPRRLAPGMASTMKHQYRTRSGIQAKIRIRGVTHSRHFRTGTPPDAIKEWLLKTELKYRKPSTRKTGHFDDDARAYLEAVTAMPTFTQRKAHVDDWIAAFGHRWRDHITADEIRAQLHAWRTTPRTVKRGRFKTVTLTLSASACNKRRTALMHLFSVLDGRAAINPVKDVPKFQEPAPAPKHLTDADVRAIFAAMPSSKAKARLMVIAYTGIPHAQVATLSPDDVFWDARQVAVQGRRKGAGTRGRLVPLTAKGLAAMRLMARYEAWGGFSREPLKRALRRACQRALGHARITPYDLRHFFGSEMYRRSGDIRATQILLDHSTPTLTHRYTLAAVDPRVQKAVRAWR